MRTSPLLLFVVALAACSGGEEPGAISDSSDAADVSDVSVASDSSDPVDASGGSDASDTSDPTDTSDASDAADTSDASDATNTSDPADEPDTSDASDAADTSDATDITDAADTSDPAVPEPVCGNGEVEVGEVCDDGNTSSGDYCSADCSAETGACGDAEQQTNETCDDGDNNDSQNGCSETCQRNDICGDGIVQDLFEACDDGNLDNQDGCDADCTECVPTNTCVSAAAECGIINNGCGDTIDCGICESPFSCGANGIANQCSCVDTCSSLELDCGEAQICNETTQCGSCNTPWVCGINGTLNVCELPPLPPAPEDVAPDVVSDKPQSPADGFRFLAEGDDPIQREATEEALEQANAVLRGRVLDTTGEPLPAVRVSFKGHDGLGYTLTREDGVFDLLCPAGEELIVKFEQADFLTSRRTITVSEGEYGRLDDVALVRKAPAMETLVLAELDETRMMVGETVVDDDGARTGFMIVPAGLQAGVHNVDGFSEPLDQLTMRFTEYTVGEHGQISMPTPLPEGTGYTYCVELSVDEVDNADDVNILFDRPMYYYIEAFIDLQYPFHKNIPAGYFNRETGKWEAQPNGRKLHVVPQSSGMINAPADLDMSDEERRYLNDRFTEPTTVWRVPIQHFSSWDFNWPLLPIEGAGGSPGGEESGEDDKPGESDDDDQGDDTPEGEGGDGAEDVCNEEGCEILPFAQVLRERVPLIGTGLSLHYSSDHSWGRRDEYRREITLTGDTAPELANTIHARFEVAGQSITQTFPSVANLKTTFEWDGYDTADRRSYGVKRLKTSIGYQYPAVYREPSAGEANFGSTGYFSHTVGEGREDIIIWADFYDWIGAWDTKMKGLGGWSIGAHHYYSPTRKKIYFGNGDTRKVKPISKYRFETLAGNGEIGSAADGSNALESPLTYPVAAVQAEDGTIYVSDTESFVVRSIDSNGIIQVVAGIPGSNGYLGTGVAATSVPMGYPTGLAFGPDGALYIADGTHARIKRLDLETNIITNVAGNGTFGPPSENVPATQSSIVGAAGITFDSEGGLYVAARNSHRVQYISPDGYISTVAGNGNGGFNGDGEAASSEQLFSPYDVAVSPTGEVVIADSGNHRIRKVASDGTMTTIVGTGVAGRSRAGLLASQVSIHTPTSVTFDENGLLVFTEQGAGTVVRIGEDNVIQHLIGGAPSGDSLSEGDSNRASLNMPVGVSLANNNTLLLADTFNQRLLRMRPSRVGFDDMVGELVASPSGSGLFEFSAWKHLSTRDAFTGRKLLEFEYIDDRLSAIVNPFGERIEIVRNLDGTIDIQSPFGVLTNLAINEKGMLSRVTLPDTSAWDFEYNDLELLSRIETPTGGASTFTYENGRLHTETDSAGYTQTFTREESETGYSVTYTSAENWQRRWDVDWLSSNGWSFTSTTPSGFQAVTSNTDDGWNETVYPDGTVVKKRYEDHARFGEGQRSVQEQVITLPSGISRTLRTESEFLYADVNNPNALTTEIHKFYDGDQSARIEIQAAGEGKNIVATQPSGQMVQINLDAYNRPIERIQNGFDTVTYTYDDYRLNSVQQGSGEALRELSLSWDEATGLITQMNNSGDTTRDYTFNSLHQVDTVTQDNQTMDFSFNAMGSMEILTLPDGTEHEQSFDGRDLLSGYTPPLMSEEPGAGNETMVYNGYRQPVSIGLSDGTSIDITWDDSGRPQSVATASTTQDFTYSTSTGQLTNLATGEGESLAFSYDGFLLLEELWTGSVAGRVHHTYNNQFLPATQELNDSGEVVTFIYDTDQRLVSAGELTVDWSNITPLEFSDSVGNFDTEYTLTSLGQLEEVETFYNNESRHQLQMAYDNQGRLETRTEQIVDMSKSWFYVYDGQNQLAQVYRDDVLVEDYTYDLRGNLVSVQRGDNTYAATYDAQDRLMTFGDASYAFSPTGHLASKTDGAGTTTYTYDAFSNLKHVELPSGTSVDYVVDARNRRMGKKVDGTLVQGFLYQDQLNPVAELDGNGEVVQRFVYGLQGHVPAYIMRGNTTYRIVTDQLGSVRLVIVEDTGVVAQALEYDSFGNVLVDTNPGFQPFGYAGGIYDRDTGLVRFGARDYDPHTARWTTKDPIRFAGGQANLYVYVANQPNMGIDPSGKYAWVLGTTVAGAVSGAVAAGITSGGDPAQIVAGGLAGGLAGVLIGTGQFALARSSLQISEAAIIWGGAGLSNGSGQLLGNLVAGGKDFNWSQFAAGSLLTGAYGFIGSGFGLAQGLHTGAGELAAMCITDRDGCYEFFMGNCD